MARIGMKLIESNKGKELEHEQSYWEVDIEYTTGAKMVLLGVDEDDVRSLLAREFNDIPNLNIINISLAGADLVEEAKARRAFEDAAVTQSKKELN